MPCTTLLIGKKASYDGSTIVARNEDSGSGSFTPKRFVVVSPEEQPRHYVSKIAHLAIDLPDNPQRYTALPNALLDEGIWAEAGVNEHNVSMSATETLTTNERVLGADPFVVYKPAKGKPGEEGYEPEVAGGIGEEDMVTIVLPYITSARDGVKRLGALLEQYGTYEMNGIAFSDVDEIWWLETVGGHHWIAKRVPDDAYVTMPNQLGIDAFDLDDAFGAQKDYMCSSDMREFVEKNHLDLTLGGGLMNPRDAFGSHSDSDHVYNTPRAWVMQRFLNPHALKWDGEDAELTPESDDIPWSRVPERKLTIEDVKYALSLHYQGTPYDPYSRRGGDQRGMYRPIGINRNSQLSVVQLRPYEPASCQAVQWVAYGSNVFNALVPFYTNVTTTPAYLEKTDARVTTECFYWENRIIAALADAHFHDAAADVERYQEKVGGMGHAMLHETDALAEKATGDVQAVLEAANQKMADELKDETDALLSKVLFSASMGMKNSFSKDDM
ncbi:MAG: C69 family dipeptidase [Atopobiaceae bacterium]